MLNVQAAPVKAHVFTTFVVRISMAILRKIYGDNSLALVADLYQFTAAYAFWKADLHNTQTCFNMFHRTTPFDGGYAICAGTEYVQDWVSSFKPD